MSDSEIKIKQKTQPDLEEPPLSNSTEKSCEPLKTETFFWDSSLFRQGIVTLVALIILLMVIKNSDQPALQWIKDKFYVAVTATTENTFGYLSSNPFYQKVVTKCSNLVRLEDITKELSQKYTSRQSLEKTVWPVNGKIVRPFGWWINPQTNNREFFPGIGLRVGPASKVVSLAAGKVTEIINHPQKGHQVTINHGMGWTSTFFYLDNLVIQKGIEVAAGAQLGLTRKYPIKDDYHLIVEIRYFGQPIDPLTVLAI